jgi:hypothetical protein
MRELSEKAEQENTCPERHQQLEARNRRDENVGLYDPRVKTPDTPGYRCGQKADLGVNGQPINGFDRKHPIKQDSTRKKLDQVTQYE